MSDLPDLTDMPEVHPAAAVWPMLPEDELRELAASIEEVGLLEPLVDTPDGLLLDGRNRWAACRLAGVEPRWTTHEGDPVAYVIARNATRRHMITGQRAMAVALTLEASGKRENGRWEYGEMLGTQHSGVRPSTWRGVMAQAGDVLDHARDLAPLVVSGARTLGAAYAEAQGRAKESDDDADARAAKAEADNERLAKLADVAPDLATQVREGDLSLEAAEARAETRAQQRAEAVGRTSRRVGDVTTLFAYACPNDVMRAELADNFDPAHAGVPPDRPVTSDALRLAASNLEWLADQLEERSGE